MGRSDKMESVIDTNVLVYALIEDSIFHEECLRKLEMLRRIFLPITVIEELVLVLKKLGIEESMIRRQVKEIVSDPKVVLVNLEKKDVESAISILERERLTVKRFNDKLILLAAKKNDLPIYTFDRELKKECGKLKVKIL